MQIQTDSVDMTNACEAIEMAAANPVPVSNVGTSKYEPFLENGKYFGDIHWLRTESGGEGMLLAGFWSHAPAELPYECIGDETIHVLEGEVVVELEGGESVTLQEGDVASFSKGQKSVWRIVRPFKKFFVVSG